VPAPLLRAYLDRGIPVVQVYGSTETAPIVIHQRIPDAFRTAGSTGKPALHCAAKVCGPDGRELPPGEKGEIVVRGPNVMIGYWRDPEATAAVLKDGWFWTGDAGHVDADGNFYVDDRIKDVIISGSENIYPAEVELVLDECRDIAESAVVARPDARWGEVPVACVVRRPGCALSREQVLALFSGRLARYKHPHDVVFMDRLPRNVMGKILKYELRARLASDR
jgi:fatty-acyl-CoA synthase